MLYWGGGLIYPKQILNQSINEEHIPYSNQQYNNNNEKKINESYFSWGKGFTFKLKMKMWGKWGAEVILVGTQVSSFPDERFLGICQESIRA